MKLLFVKLKNIGDALMLTPTLTAARELYPDAQIDVLLRGGTEEILKGSLALTNIYTTAAPEASRRSRWQLFSDLALLKKLRKEKYDWVFELSDNNRGRFMSYFSGAKNRAAHAAYDFPFWAKPFFNHKSPLLYADVHRCEKDLELLRSFCGYTGEAKPLEFDRSFVDWSWTQANVTQAPIVVHAVTRWRRKMWPVEKWKELVEKLSAEAPVVLTSGNDAQEIALTKEIASVNPSRISITEGKLTWPQMAGLLYSARLLVTVDTATMHLGAACQTPLVAIFGPTNITQWSPWKCRHELLAPCDEVKAKVAPEQQIATIPVDKVWEACQKMWVADAPVQP